MSEKTDAMKDSARKFADLALEKAGELAAFAKGKAEETADSVKLDMAISKSKKTIREEYEMLGEVVYNIQKGKLRENEEILAASVKRIDEAIEELKELTVRKEESKAETKASFDTFKENAVNAAKAAARGAKEKAADAYEKFKNKPEE